MQDRYTGDVGDFGKYGLLKALCRDDLSLGVVWYLFPDEEGSGDGSYVRYLEPTPANLRRFRDCDPALYDTLGEIVRSRQRRVASIQERSVLPADALLYEERLFFESTQSTERRLEYRKAWAWDALAATRGRDVVFVDPDNGLESGTPRHYLKGPKYAYFDELVPYLDRGQSLVVYHHHHWSARADTQVRERLSQISERLGPTFALRYLRGAPRTFFVIPSEARRSLFSERARQFARDPCWSKHFTLVDQQEERGIV